jgi:hypothetical protein
VFCFIAPSLLGFFSKPFVSDPVIFSHKHNTGTEDEGSIKKNKKQNEAKERRKVKNNY